MTTVFFWMIIAYGFSTILVYGSIFDTQRDWIKKNSNFFGTLIGCMLCTSTWVGFFMSFVLGSLTRTVIPNQLPQLFNIFFDGMFTAGAVWAINAFVEFFEESRIK